MFKIFSKTWGQCEAGSIKVTDFLVIALDVTRMGKPFQTECMFPLHDVTLIVTPSE